MALLVQKSGAGKKLQNPFPVILRSIKNSYRAKYNGFLFYHRYSRSLVIVEV